MLAIASK